MKAPDEDCQAARAAADVEHAVPGPQFRLPDQRLPDDVEAEQPGEWVVERQEPVATHSRNKGPFRFSECHVALQGWFRSFRLSPTAPGRVG